MPEQAARSTAGSRAIKARAEDRNLRQTADGRPAGEAGRATPRQRNLRVVPDSPPGSDRAGTAAVARRTVVIRGQVADRYATHASVSYRSSRSYGLRMRPDRAALWAVLLGLALVIAALASANM
jgi:hypothetical protein